MHNKDNCVTLRTLRDYFEKQRTEIGGIFQRWYLEAKNICTKIHRSLCGGVRKPCVVHFFMEISPGYTKLIRLCRKSLEMLHEISGLIGFKIHLHWDMSTCKIDENI